MDMKRRSSKVVTSKPDSRPPTKSDMGPRELIIKKDIVLTWIPGTRPVKIPREIPINVKSTENKSIETELILSAHHSAVSDLLLPLYGSRGLVRYVVDHPVDLVLHLVGDLSRYPIHDLGRHLAETSGHRI